MTTASSANPGRGPTIKVGFSNGQESWEEQADLVELLASALAQKGHEFRRDGDRLVNADGLALRPQFVSLEPQHPKGANCTSTIEFTHPRFGDAPFFEYQHAAGDDLTKAFTSGFEMWAQFDLPAISDALRRDPEACSALAMTFPASEERATPLKRRAVLGPPAHLVAKRDDGDEAHPFCPCCLFTNSIEAFKPLLESDSMYGLRMFAMRNESGVAEADCRVNGEDFEPGKAALIKYAESWPQRGFEFRKQYVILQTDAD